MLVAGLAAELTYGVAAGDVGRKLAIGCRRRRSAAARCWLLAAVTLALWSIAPRFTPVAWGVPVGLIAVYLLGSLSRLPQWLLDL